MSLKSYRELIVWQKGIDLTVLVYSIVRGFPSEEKFSISSQMTRAAVSIPSNIAEGFGRYSSVEFARFLRMSLGSLFELQTQLEIAKRLNYVDNIKFNEILELSNEIERMTNSLIAKSVAISEYEKNPKLRNSEQGERLK
ncbi:MAG: four helix bundle protein [Sedimentisphaerales bacterium]|nr:four helix bundle protein [Sedimentisphaerales bacterium]